jgi:hypothetical protein
MIRCLLFAAMASLLQGCQSTSVQAAIEKCAGTRSVSHVVGAIGKDSRVDISCFSPAEMR